VLLAQKFLKEADMKWLSVNKNKYTTNEAIKENTKCIHKI